MITKIKRVSEVEVGDHVRFINDFAEVIENSKQVARGRRYIVVRFASGKTQGVDVSSNSKVEVLNEGAN